MKRSTDAEDPIGTGSIPSEPSEWEASTVFCSPARVRLLAVSQSPKFTSCLARSVRDNELSWVVTMTNSAEHALQAILAGAHDIVALDWNIGPDMTGADLCRKARAEGCVAALVVFTARGAIGHRLQALEAGANDYLVKGAMHWKELMARLAVAAIRAGALRPRPDAKRDAITPIGPLTVHPENHSLLTLGNLLELPRHQRRLLVRLAQSAGHVVSREELCTAAGISPGFAFKNLHNEILRLRRLLGPAAAPRVETVRSTGYRLS